MAPSPRLTTRSVLAGSAAVAPPPPWYADAGSISLYYVHRALLRAKTRVFVDFVVEAFRRDRLAERFAGVPAG